MKGGTTGDEIMEIRDESCGDVWAHTWVQMLGCHFGAIRTRLV